ncbi:hypothetical protein AB4305_23905 [Nocardia sp. 2YAB30]
MSGQGYVTTVVAARPLAACTADVEQVGQQPDHLPTVDLVLHGR